MNPFVKKACNWSLILIMDLFAIIIIYRLTSKCAVVKCNAQEEIIFTKILVLLSNLQPVGQKL